MDECCVPHVASMTGGPGAIPMASFHAALLPTRLLVAVSLLQVWCKSWRERHSRCRLGWAPGLTAGVNNVQHVRIQVTGEFGTAHTVRCNTFIINSSYNVWLLAPQPLPSRALAFRGRTVIGADVGVLLVQPKLTLLG
jgi:hypothetical protein